MADLDNIWYYVENLGVPILAIFGLLTYGSFMFYLIDLKNLRRMENQLSSQGSLTNFKYHHFTFIGLNEIFNAFRRISAIESAYLEDTKIKRQVAIVRGYRKFYKIAIPTIIGLATIGITINELIIDK